MMSEENEDTRRGILRSVVTSGMVLMGVAGASFPASAGTKTDQQTTPEGDGEPEFRCSYVDLSAVSSGSDALVAFTDGTFVNATDGFPTTLGSEGRVVDFVEIDGTRYENPNTDCDVGSKAVTFTRRSVTVRRREFVRDWGNEPPEGLFDVVLYFADGTRERREQPSDATDTFRGTGTNGGKTLVAFRLNHAAFRTTHFWPNPRIEDPTDVDLDGLINAEEELRRTDPTDTDTDDDGWSDLSELNRGYDPLDPDSTP
ncbi:hypothetical protein [Halogeometricum luteum]|uniref:Uncharacterized protein n=1 Tax=Halogeometricum luteum TaxID=2950537 RepID=A0ABU2G4P4_9EURY|nr:hypothetical protein [Halogeometricum sp. S3BR5-2]MDS0295762.1 hypothetical protein [Halogeometricum sp. S3BR5-2]